MMDPPDILGNNECDTIKCERVHSAERTAIREKVLSQYSRARRVERRQPPSC